MLHPARWLDRLNVALVIAGVAGAMGAASPFVLRAAGVLEPPVVTAPPRLPSARPGIAPPRGTARAFDDHPHFLPDDDPPRITELERQYPDGMWPGQHQGRRDLPEPATSSRQGIARGPLTVREQADILAKITGRVPAGAPIRLLHEKGEWALIASRTDAGTVVGWTARSAILLP